MADLVVAAWVIDPTVVEDLDGTLLALDGAVLAGSEVES